MVPLPSVSSPLGVTSKRSVRVPIQRHRPSIPAVSAISGVISTGTASEPAFATENVLVTAGGKPVIKKDLSMMAMAYGDVYVAQVAYGAKDIQVLRAFLEAESYDGPSVIIAYSPCIAHGIDLSNNLRQQNLAVNSGNWGLFRYDPRKADAGENPLHLDSKEPTIPYRDFAMSETRFAVLERTHPDAAHRFMEVAQHQTKAKFHLYQQLAKIAVGETDSD